jgi:hypothetical protein
MAPVRYGSFSAGTSVVFDRDFFSRGGPQSHAHLDGRTPGSQAGISAPMDLGSGHLTITFIEVLYQYGAQ